MDLKNQTQKRTIKFRGKRIKGGDWIYGSLVKELYNYYIVELIDQTKEAYTHISVEKETVGQFTGLHDKNGKEIYEGDIVTDGVGKYKIIYDLRLAGYQPYCIFRDDPENYCEVIGNIYENPDLVKL